MYDLSWALFIQEKIGEASSFQRLFATLGSKVYIGHEKRPRWSDYLPIYLFVCPECDILSCDYPHGFPHRRYLTCHFCRAHIDFVGFKTMLLETVSYIRFLLHCLIFKSKTRR